MITQETVNSAIKWVDVGSRWIENGAVRLGLNYLERAIAAFSEGAELSWLNYAKHQKMNGLIQASRDDEAMAMFDGIMDGYSKLGDAYGQALLLSHLAKCTEKQGRGERALVNLNLAYSIAEAEKFNFLLAHVLAQKGQLALNRENLLLAVKLFREAEELTYGEGLENEAMLLRFSATEALVQLGENAEAMALLEDLQTRLIRNLRFRQALKPLHLLSRLYEELGSWDEKNRISQLVHLCSQNIIKKDSERKTPDNGEPLIRPFHEKAS